MTSVLYGQNKLVAQWVWDQLGFGECDPDAKGIGILHDDKLICGVVYNDYRIGMGGLPLSMEMSIASIDKRWINRDNLRALFAYPFIQLNVKRVQATTHADNMHVRSFLARLGFTFEGIGREAHPLGGDAAVYSMLQHECRWINNGQRLQGTSSTRSGSDSAGTRRSQQRNSHCTSVAEQHEPKYALWQYQVFAGRNQ